MTTMNNASFQSCLSKQQQIKTLFSKCNSQEEFYKKIIELGKTLPPIAEENKIEKNIVHGCQSILYLSTRCEKGILFFSASSEALISAGLAFLLISIYNNETPETLLKCPPLFIKELGLQNALTPGRSNGLSNMYIRMKQDALKYITNLL